MICQEVLKNIFAEFFVQFVFLCRYFYWTIKILKKQTIPLTKMSASKKANNGQKSKRVCQKQTDGHPMLIFPKLLEAGLVVGALSSAVQFT